MSLSREESFNKQVRDLLKEHAAKSQEKSSASDVSDVSDEDLKYKESMEQPVVGYRLMEKMGSGGMGAVFKAESIATEQLVAIKLLFPGHDEDKKVLQQFINEGMLLIKLNHPNILKGLDFGISKGIYFLAIEYVEGESLFSHLEKGLKFTEERAFRLALQICTAITYLEEKGVIHRDIKPANILLLEDTAKLCDFALALDLSRVDNDATEQSEVTCGTVEYISPEQARGDANLDNRSDIYSLGITCIHMISGKLPFSGDDSHEIMRQQIYEPIKLEKLGYFSPPARKVLSWMVAKNKQQRPPAKKMASMLKKLLRRYNK